MSLPHHNLVAWQRADDLELKIRQVSAPLRGLIRRYRAEGALVKTITVLSAIFAATAFVNERRR